MSLEELNRKVQGKTEEEVEKILDQVEKELDEQGVPPQDEPIQFTEMNDEDEKDD